MVKKIGFRYQPTCVRVLPILFIHHCDLSHGYLTSLNLFPPNRKNNFSMYSLGSLKTEELINLKCLAKSLGFSKYSINAISNSNYFTLRM